MHHLETRQKVPVRIEKAWGFFSDPENLSLITPPEMGFRITSRSGDKMYPGMIIRYRVSPLFRIKLTWVTEITHVVEQQYFVDEQRIGPYRMWHHQHHFRSIEGGTEISDRVDYALPLGCIGRMLNRLMVRRKLQHIFKYREEKIREVLGDYPA